MNKNFVLLVLISIIISSCSHPFKIYYNFFKSENVKPVKENIQVALVLGSGGARSVAHLGVLEVLEQNNIPIDLIVGTSGGSIVGALYADHPNAAELKARVFDFNKNDIVDFSLLSMINGAYSTRSSLADGNKGEKFLEKNMKAKSFDQLQIPFIAIATDVITGKTVELDSGPIPPAVRASYSVPGLFPPVQLYGMTLVDGGVTAPLGIETARKYNPTIVIAVDITLPTERTKVYNMLDVMYKSLNITYNTLNEMLCAKADIVIRPDVKDAGLFDDHRRDELYKAGIKAATKAIPLIKKMLDS